MSFFYYLSNNDLPLDRERFLDLVVMVAGILASYSVTLWFMS